MGHSRSPVRFRFPETSGMENTDGDVVKAFNEAGLRHARPALCVRMKGNPITLPLTPYHYPVLSARFHPGSGQGWNDDAWRRAPVLRVDAFRPESSSHRPRTRAKLLVDAQALYGLFQVQDRYIHCRHTRFQSPVYQDSCVEFFVQPRQEGGYFNFEFNCGGALLASYITDPTRTANGFKAFQRLTPEEGRQVERWASLPATVMPEMTEARTWYLGFQIPLSLLTRYAGPVDVREGAVWRANFYKCGDATSHPHWAAWRPVDELNFHRPDCFGWLHFERPTRNDPPRVTGRL